MPDDWYYTRNHDRAGPVSFARLKAMADSGWLAPDDLVWRAGMADWVTARDAEGLFPNPLRHLLHRTIAGLRPAPEQPPGAHPRDVTPPGIPPRTTRSAARGPAVKPRELIDWESISPRHVVAACGGFLAALGIAFTAIAHSRVALAFTLSGLVVVAAGLSVEIGRLLGQAVENIGKASKEAADRRLRAQELALEQRRLDVEAARLAHERALREPPPAPVAVPAGREPESALTAAAGTGQVVVINHPPVQRWSPGLAAVLSFFVPGLGQLYKGQILNGIVWFLVVGIGYLALIVPGLVLHFFCVLGALSGNPWTEGRTTVVRQ